MRKPHVVSDYAREANLARHDISAETERMQDRFLNVGTGDARNPVGVLGKKRVNHRHIQPLFVGGNFYRHRRCNNTLGAASSWLSSTRFFSSGRPPWLARSSRSVIEPWAQGPTPAIK